MEKKGALGKILALVGALVVIGGAVAAIIHFWEEIKAKLPCCCKKDEFEEIEDFEDFMEEELDELEDVAEEIQDDMADFVEFEEI